MNLEDRKLKKLTDIKKGHRVLVSEIAGGRGLKSRLNAMGVIPGTSLTVISMNGGPAILDVMGTRLMLGRGMARKVLVQQL